MTAPNQLSFLPDDYLDGKAQRRTNIICAALFVIVILALVGVFMFVERPLQQARLRNADISRQYTEAARPIEQFRQMQEKQKQVTMQAELAASLLERVPRSFVLAEVTNALPPGTSLIDVSLESKARTTAAAAAASAAPKTQFELKKAALEKKPATPGAEPRAYDVQMKITGMADTDIQVAQFMNKLSHSKLLKDVNLVVSDEYEHSKEKVRKFQIEMMLNPDAEVEHADQGAKPVIRTADTAPGVR